MNKYHQKPELIEKLIEKERKHLMQRKDVSPEGKQRIKEIPFGGWGKNGNGDFERLCRDLMAQGLREELAIDILKEAYCIVANEYGA